MPPDTPCSYAKGMSLASKGMLAPTAIANRLVTSSTAADSWRNSRSGFEGGALIPSGKRGLLRGALNAESSPCRRPAPLLTQAPARRYPTLGLSQT